MSSAYPVIWAMKHAPVADAYERLLLIAMADAADEDGCNSYRSMRSHMRIATNVSKSTIVRRQTDMAERGLIRPDTTPPPQRYLDIPEHKRPPRWEVCIPCSWWSESQLEEVNRRREDLGLEVITPKNRPDLSEAPERPKRADKGVPAPKRGRKKKQASGGVSQTPLNGTEEGCLEDTSGGVSQTQGGGVSKTPNPPLSDSPAVPSSPPAPPVSGSTHVPTVTDEGREDEHNHSPEGQGEGGSDGAAEDPEALQSRALALVDEAVRRWPKRHKAPGARDRMRLAARISDELASGGVEETLVHELTRDLQDAGSAISVIMGSRTTVPGWGQNNDPRPDHTRYEISQSAPWCGVCDERTRMVVIRDTSTGEERPGRCRRPVTTMRGEKVACNPNSTLAQSFDSGPQVQEHAPVEEGPELASEIQNSLDGNGLGTEQAAPKPRMLWGPTKVDARAHAEQARQILEQTRNE